MHLLRSRKPGVAWRQVGAGALRRALRPVESTFLTVSIRAREPRTEQPGGRMKSVRRWAIGGVTTAAAGVLMAAAAFACVSGPVVNLSTINAKAGQEVGITGTGFQAANAAQIRWNALDGPVLTTVPAPITGGNMDAKFTVPEGTKAGSYVVIITQTKADGTLTLSPVRAVMSVTGDAGSNPVLGANGTGIDQTVR